MRASLFLLLLLPASCGVQSDPVYRPGDWLPEGSNARNIAAMLAEPSDLIRGRGEPGADSPLAIKAVTRLMEGKAKLMPSVSSQSDIAPTGGATGAPSGGS